MTREELTIIHQAVLLSSYSKKQEALRIIQRDLKLKDMDPRKSDDAEEKGIPKD